MLIVLGVIGLSYSSSVRTQLQAAGQSRGRMEAYWAARAGIEKVSAMLFAADLTALGSEDPLFNDEEAFKEQQVGAAQFSIVSPLPSEEPVYGIVDEAALLNINVADEATLMLLPGMTEEMAQCLIDWQDGDSRPGLLGAEEDYYQTLEDPYPPRNDGFESVRELMRVRSWDAAFRGAYPDPYAKFLPEDQQPEAAIPEDALMLLTHLTACSQSEREAPDARDKLNLTSPDSGQMRRRIRGLTEQEAKAIVDRNAKTKFKAVTDLLDATIESDNSSKSGSSSASSSGRSSSSSNSKSGDSSSSSSAGKKAFSLARVGEIIDYFTIEDGDDPIAGLINVNTASNDVLMLLKGMTETLAQSIIQERAANGAIKSPGAIASLPGMTDSAFRAIYPRIATTSKRFRVVSRGFAPDSKAAVSIEATLEVADDGVNAIYWREF